MYVCMYVYCGTNFRKELVKGDFTSPVNVDICEDLLKYEWYGMQYKVKNVHLLSEKNIIIGTESVAIFCGGGD